MSRFPMGSVAIGLAATLVGAIIPLSLLTTILGSFPKALAVYLLVPLIGIAFGVFITIGAALAVFVLGPLVLGGLTTPPSACVRNIGRI